MEKFWDWMEEKRYYENNDYDIKKISNELHYSTIRPTKQMLVGYMIEYLMDIGIPFGEMIPGPLQYSKSLEIDDIYDWLEVKIKEEMWRPIAGYEGLYDVGNFGNVRTLRNSTSLKKYDIMSKIPHNLGYLRTNLIKNGVKVTKYNHILVAEAFIEKPSKNHEVNHKDLDKTNNYVNNLEYITHKDNLIHASGAGLFTKTRGEGDGMAKLNNKYVLDIVFLLNKNVLQKHIGQIYGVSPVNISHIKTGKTWTHITNKKKFV